MHTIGRQDSLPGRRRSFGQRIGQLIQRQEQTRQRFLIVNSHPMPAFGHGIGQGAGHQRDAPADIRIVHQKDMHTAHCRLLFYICSLINLQRWIETKEPIAPGKTGIVSSTFDAKAIGRFQKPARRRLSPHPLYTMLPGAILLPLPIRALGKIVLRTPIIFCEPIRLSPRSNEAGPIKL